MKVLFCQTFLLLYLTCLVKQKLQAQQVNCSFKEPLYTIDFGSGEDKLDMNNFPPYKYRRDFGTCPNDGNYSFTSYTSDCFNGDWLTFNEDHTLNDINGNMMLVNANPRGGVFLNTTINGLKSNITYRLAAWMVNVCRIRGGCAPLPPNIVIKLITQTGRIVGLFQTGVLAQNAAPQWKKYAANFTTPSNVSSLILTMEDVTHGGCGNDFALDDITLQECVVPPPIAKIEDKPVEAQIENEKMPVIKPKVEEVPAKKITVNAQPVKVDSTIVITERKLKTDTPVIAKPVLKEKPALPLPEPITTRENLLIKKIETTSGEITIDLYDNGQIDGDTVSIYHNNELIISGAALSAKPVILHISVDIFHPHHELVMVADNLGSIPPNTSLMIITAGDKRYEISISSSEENNAKVMIDLKK